MPPCPDRKQLHECPYTGMRKQQRIRQGRTGTSFDLVGECGNSGTYSIVSMHDGQVEVGKEGEAAGLVVLTRTKAKPAESADGLKPAEDFTYAALVHRCGLAEPWPPPSDLLAPSQQSSPTIDPLPILDIHSPSPTNLHQPYSCFHQSSPTMAPLPSRHGEGSGLG